MIRDGFLGRDLARACIAAVEALDHLGQLTPAAVGRRRVHDPTIRADHTTWLDPDAPVPLSAAWAAFEALRQRLNRDAWLGLRRFAVQIARYPGEGHGYVRHTDALAGDVNRRITAILYLNDGWAPDWGGHLVASTPDGPIRVAPTLDRLVIFRSEAVPHEVEPAFRPRRALTAWYRGAEPIPTLPGS